MKITAFHASKNCHNQAHDGLTYFSPNPSYQYLKTLPYRHEAELDLSKAFWCEDVSFVETLRSNTDTVERLKALGYNAVVYASHKNMLIGASGWGNDCSQIVTLTSEPIKYWASVEPYAPLAQTYTPPKNILGPVYHGTDAFFIQYERGSDAGVHFGSKGAALDRMRQTIRSIDVSIEQVSASKIDIDRLKLKNGDWPSGKLHETYALLLRKIQAPRANTFSILSALSEKDLNDIVAEYSAKPDATLYIDTSIAKAKLHGQYEVRVHNETFITTPTKEEAEWYSKVIKQHELKSAYIHANKLLDLEDGVFSPMSILSELLKVEPRAKRFFDCVSSAKDNEELHAIMMNALAAFGYDGVKYVNQVEDPGSESYLICDTSKIIPVAQKLPRQPVLAPTPIPETPKSATALRPKV